MKDHLMRQVTNLLYRLYYSSLDEVSVERNKLPACICMVLGNRSIPLEIGINVYSL